MHLKIIAYNEVKTKRTNLMKHKTGFAVFLAFLVMCVIVSASYLNYKKIQDNVIEIEQLQLLSLAETLSKSIENFFTYQLHNLEIVANSRSFTRDFQGVESIGDGEDTFQNLEDYYTIQSESIELIRLVDIDGKELYTFPVTDYSDHITVDITRIQKGGVQDVGAIYKEADQLYVNTMYPIVEDGTVKAVLYTKVKLNTIYQSLVAPVKAGVKGYASIKDSSGALIMHPNTEDIGENVIETRKSTYPDFDWTELELLVEKQKNKESGVGIYHSLWFTDNDQVRVKKFSAYAPADIGTDFWIVNVSKDYLEVVSFLKERTYNIIIINFIIILTFVTMGFVYYRFKRDNALIEKERALLVKVNSLNAELTRSKNKFEKIFESGSDCIFVVTMDSNADILEVNTKAVNSLGFSKETMYGKSYFDINSEVKKKQFLPILETLETTENAIFEDTLVGIDGRKIPVEINAKVMVNENQKQIVMISRDITMKKLFELEMEESKKKEALMIYQSRLAAMGEMIGSIAHQWRQPLSGLSMIYNNLIDAYQYNDLDEAFLISQGQRHNELVKFMSATIDDFRFFFDPKIETKDFLISNVMDRTLDFLKETIRLNNIDIVYMLDQDVLMHGRPNQLSQVLFSILKNAIDAVLEQAGNKRCLWIDISNSNEVLTFTIEDSGGGTDQANLDKLFDAYFTTKDAQNGTGLGLYISKVIVEKNFEGIIEAYNTENGLCVKIVIPINQN